MRAPLSALALGLGMVWLGTSLPGPAVAQPYHKAHRAAPAPETEAVPSAERAPDAARPQDDTERAEPAQEGEAVPTAERASDSETLPTVERASEAGAASEADDVAAAEPPPDPAVQVADWVIASGDNRGLPFAIIDKVAATIVVFDAKGKRKGAAPALLGSARGDESTPGVGDRELSGIPPQDRTTPAGRFLAGFGPAWGSKQVLWVDYATAISLHPVITGNPKEHRLQRLKSPTPKDNRITFGCINVPTAFYSKVVRPTFSGKKKNGVVYILPEAMPLIQALPAFQAQPRATSARADNATSGGAP